MLTTPATRSLLLSVPTLPGITARTIASVRLTTRVLFSGDEAGAPVVFVHGNLTSATFWEETMLAMPAGYRCIAHDQRGFGAADADAAVDGARGLAVSAPMMLLAVAVESPIRNFRRCCAMANAAMAR